MAGNSVSGAVFSVSDMASASGWVSWSSESVCAAEVSEKSPLFSVSSTSSYGASSEIMVFSEREFSELTIFSVASAVMPPQLPSASDRVSTAASHLFLFRIIYSSCILFCTSEMTVAYFCVFILINGHNSYHYTINAAKKWHGISSCQIFCCIESISVFVLY